MEEGEERSIADVLVWPSPVCRSNFNLATCFNEKPANRTEPLDRPTEKMRLRLMRHYMH